MTKVTLQIWDDGAEVKAEGTMDNPNAVNEAPTGALIIGTYLATHFDQIAKDAMTWFERDVPKSDLEADVPTLVEPAPKIIVPGSGGLQ